MIKFTTEDAGMSDITFTQGDPKISTVDIDVSDFDGYANTSIEVEHIPYLINALFDMYGAHADAVG